jgi:hypothetical protein
VLRIDTSFGSFTKIHGFNVVSVNTLHCVFYPEKQFGEDQILSHALRTKFGRNPNFVVHVVRLDNVVDDWLAIDTAIRPIELHAVRVQHNTVHSGSLAGWPNDL